MTVVDDPTKEAVLGIARTMAFGQGSSASGVTSLILAGGVDEGF